jgi:hypothetical protein
MDRIGLLEQTGLSGCCLGSTHTSIHSLSFFGPAGILGLRKAQLPAPTVVLVPLLSPRPSPATGGIAEQLLASCPWDPPGGGPAAAARDGEYGGG